LTTIGDFEQIQEMHKQNILPNSKRPHVFRGPSGRIGSPSENLERPNEGTGPELVRTFLISENQTLFLDLDSNTGFFDDTRQADNNTEGFLVISRDSPESGEHARSGADSLAESDKYVSDWTDAGDDLVSASRLRQPESEFGCCKPNDFKSGKHDVAVFLNESILPGEEEHGEKHEGIMLKKDLDELADEEVCFIIENREEEGMLKGMETPLNSSGPQRYRGPWRRMRSKGSLTGR
jgi:hypothetical protein